MADDDRRSDQFIREVDEELRRAQLKDLWDRFAPVFIGVCLIVVAVTAGYRGWIRWEERRAAQAGDRFMAALESIGGGDREAGEAALEAIASEAGTGYAALARLRLAGEKEAAGEKADALSHYDAIAGDNSVPETLREVAWIRGALLALDESDLEGATERAEPLNEAGNPWRHAAREVLGMAVYEAGNLQQARDYFDEIQQDAQSPADLWARSGMMISLIDGQLAAPEAVDGPARSQDAVQEQAPAEEAAPAELPLAADEAPVLPDLPPPGSAEPESEAPIPPQ